MQFQRPDNSSNQLTFFTLFFLSLALFVFTEFIQFSCSTQCTGTLEHFCHGHHVGKCKKNTAKLAQTSKLIPFFWRCFFSFFLWCSQLFGALLRGCGTHLAHLNVSHNSFNTKKGKEIPPSFKQFFTSSLSLKHVNISYCKLPMEALK